jgi:hypothetical protein
MMDRQLAAPALQFRMTTTGATSGTGVPGCNVYPSSDDSLRCEERFGRWERPGGKAELPRQVWQRLTYGRVVVDDPRRQIAVARG